MSTSLTAPVRATILAVNIGLLGTITGTFTTAIARPVARVYLGDAVRVLGVGARTFTATATVTATADGTGVSGGLGFAAGVTLVTAHLFPTIGAFTVGNNVINGGDLTFSASLNAGVSPTGNGTAYAKATLGSAALVAGVAAADVSAVDSSVVISGMGSGTAGATGAVSVTTVVVQRANADGLSIGFGIGAGAGVTLVDAVVGGCAPSRSPIPERDGCSTVPAGSITTKFDASPTATGTTFTVDATVNATTKARGRAVAGALGLSGVGSIVTAETVPTITTRVSGAAQVTGNVLVRTTAFSDADSVAQAFAVGLGAAVGIVVVDAIHKPVIATTLAGASTTGGDVSVLTDHNFSGGVFDTTKGAKVSTDMITAALGFSVGVAVIEADDQPQVSTGITGGVVSAPLGAVTVQTRSPRLADAHVSGGGGGLVSLAGMEATALVGGTTIAYVGDGTQLTARSLDVLTFGHNRTDASINVFGINAIGGSIVFADATDQSVTEARIGPAFGSSASAFPRTQVTTTGSGGIEVEATLDAAPVHSKVKVIAISLLAGGFASRATSISKPTVRAYSGDQAGVNAGSGPAELVAVAITDSISEAWGLTAGLGFTVGVTVATSLLTPTVGAFTVGGGSLGGGTVLIATRLNTDAAGNNLSPTYDGDVVAPAFSKVFMGSVALGAGLAGADVDVVDSARVTTGVGSGTATNGAFTITANIFERAHADGRSITAGLGVGAGATLVDATVGGCAATRTFISSSLRNGCSTAAAGFITTKFDGTMSSGSLAMTATVTATTLALGRAVAAALAATGVGSVVTATTVPVVLTSIGGALNATGDVSAVSKVKTDADASADAFQVALGGSVAEIFTVATLNATITTQLTGSVATTGNDVTIRSDHNYDGGFLTGNGAHVSNDTVQVGIVFSVGDSTVIATDSSNVVAQVGTNGSISAANAAVTIQSRSMHFADAQLEGVGGGLLAFGSMTATANVSGAVKAIVGDRADLLVGSLKLSAEGQNRAFATADQTGITGIGATGVDATATDSTLTEARIGPETPFGAASSSDPARVVGTGVLGIDLDAILKSSVFAQVEMFNIGLLFSSGDTDTTATSSQTVRAYIGDRAEVDAGPGSISVDAASDVRTVATGSGFGAGLGIASGGADSTATTTTIVKAFTQSGGSLGGDNVSFTSKHNTAATLPSGIGGGGPGTFATAKIGSAALLAGLSGGTARATGTPNLEAKIGTGTIVNVTGDTSLEAVAGNIAFSNARGTGAGLIFGKGASKAFATASAVVTAYLAGSIRNGTSPGGDKLSIRASVDRHCERGRQGRLAGPALQHEERVVGRHAAAGLRLHRELERRPPDGEHLGRRGGVPGGRRVHEGRRHRSDRRLRLRVVHHGHAERRRVRRDERDDRHVRQRGALRHGRAAVEHAADGEHHRRGRGRRDHHRRRPPADHGRRRRVRQPRQPGDRRPRSRRHRARRGRRPG